MCGTKLVCYLKIIKKAGKRFYCLSRDMAYFDSSGRKRISTLDLHS